MSFVLHNHHIRYIKGLYYAPTLPSLSAEARSLSPIAIAHMNEYEAVMVMKKLHWGKDGDVVCPCCGKKHEAYYILRCDSTAGCYHTPPILTVLGACCTHLPTSDFHALMDIRILVNVITDDRY